MSTRSIIAKENEDGTISAVYCHWDGYPSWNGKILIENYTTAARVDNLLKHGSISSLAEKCTKPKGHSFDSKVDGYTVYYGRDRGDEDCGPQTFENVQALDEADMWQEFEYLFRDFKWFFRETGGKWKVLTPKDCVD